MVFPYEKTEGFLYTVVSVTTAGWPADHQPGAQYFRQFSCKVCEGKGGKGELRVNIWDGFCEGECEKFTEKLVLIDEIV